MPPASSSFSALGVGFTELAHEYRALGDGGAVSKSWASTLETLRGRAERDMFGEGVAAGGCTESVRVRDEKGGAEHPANGASAPASLSGANGRVAVDFRLGVPGSGRSEFPTASANGGGEKGDRVGGERQALLGRESKNVPVRDGAALNKTAGPCVVETPYWSAIVPAGWTAESVGFGLRISR